MIYFIGALALGLVFLVYGIRLARFRTGALARQVMLASVIYLPIVFALMMVNKIAA